ncbi:hypothetical protein J6590_066419 [Homalodisca vitripennis]|nr:hypothetical protein J6590_066419 [Homalodisca vitripennis]
MSKIRKPKKQIYKTLHQTVSRRVGKRIRPRHAYNIHRKMLVAPAVTYCLMKRSNYDDQFVTTNSPPRRRIQPQHVYNIYSNKLVAPAVDNSWFFKRSGHLKKNVIESSLDVIIEEDETDEQ